MLDELEWLSVFDQYKQLVIAEKRDDVNAYQYQSHRLCERLAYLLGAAIDINGAIRVIKHKHRIAHYGHPCPKCSKVLRTPKTMRCFECDLETRIPKGPALGQPTVIFCS
jgi:hypothetical protein